ncbi:MAG: YihY/virulence factor BrkB family protein [Brumimicrobium sp.]
MSRKGIRKLSWAEVWELAKTSFGEFFKGDSFTHGAALAYYAIFALVPIIYLAIAGIGMFLGQEKIIEIVGFLMESKMGIEDVSTFTDLMYKWDIGSGGTVLLKVVGTAVLIFTSTAMFNSLRNSLNVFFNIQPNHRYNVVLESLLSRLVSFGIMALLAVIIIVVYFAQSVLIAFGNEFFSDGSFIQKTFLLVFEHFTIILVNFLIFAFIFKYLHDGVIRWKLAFGGSLFTAILLYLGQIIINYYLSNFFFAANSGIAGTLLAILTWIFYTSQIIFLGAKFTAVYARKVGRPITPK